MALREIRIYLKSGNDAVDKEFAFQVHQPFTAFMDSVMRGRFKEYSGDEVKGVNLVNLVLYTPNLICEIEKNTKRNFRAETSFDAWVTVLNTLTLETEIDPVVFTGDRIERLETAIRIFSMYGKRCTFPQMQKLLVHISEKCTTESIKESIEKADNDWKKFL